MPKLESVEAVLVHCNLVKNDYQHASKVLFTFVPNKQFGQFINIPSYFLMIMDTINTDFFFLFKFGLQTKSVKHLTLKIMSIGQLLLGSSYKNEKFNNTKI